MLIMKNHTQIYKFSGINDFLLINQHRLGDDLEDYKKALVEFHLTDSDYKKECEKYRRRERKDMPWDASKCLEVFEGISERLNQKVQQDNPNNHANGRKFGG